MEENSSFGFFSVGFCVGKNQMCCFCGWFQLAENGGGMVSKGLRAFYLSSYSKFWSGLLHQENH
jgi:hypothetical protein